MSGRGRGTRDAAHGALFVWANSHAFSHSDKISPGFRFALRNPPELPSFHLQLPPIHPYRRFLARDPALGMLDSARRVRSSQRDGPGLLSQISVLRLTAKLPYPRAGLV